jgi:uncharacterized protein (DUF2249 family)
MNTTTQSTYTLGPDRVLDVREIPCSIKHGLILQTFRDMEVGEHFILVNGHDPVPLWYQFSAEWPGTFTWDHLLKEPQEVRVKIGKLKPLETAGEQLDGGCPGH